MTTSSLQTRTAPDVTGAERYVTFEVAGEVYAVPVSNVREVIRWVAPTRVPHAGPSIKGVINLRGEIVTVVDLRTRLGLAPAEPTDRTCIIVVMAQRGAARSQVGLIVDTALEVTRISRGDIQPRSETASITAAGDVAAVARGRAGLTILLEVDRLVADGLGQTAGAEA